MRVIYTNSKGLSFDFANTPNITLYNLEGLAPTDLTSSSISKAYSNGVVVTNTHRNERQIIINLALHGGRENPKIRRALYDLLGDKEAGVFRYIDDDIDVSAEAYAQAPNVDEWTLTPTIQVSFLCPSAYLHATEETVLNLYQTDPQLTFPLTLKEGGIILGKESPVLSENVIENKGQASTGVKIVTRFTQNMSGLIVTNESNGDKLKINFKEGDEITGFKAGDILTITTEIGEKGAILYREGAYYDVFYAVDYGDRWLRLERGKNIIRYAQADDITSTGLYITISFNALYWGV